MMLAGLLQESGVDYAWISDTKLVPQCVHMIAPD